MGLSREEYFVVQRIYDGCNQLAYVLAIQLIGILAVTLVTTNRLYFAAGTTGATGTLQRIQSPIRSRPLICDRDDREDGVGL